MQRTQRERRTPLTPDVATQPLIVRGLASTAVPPRPLRDPGNITTIIIDSDIEDTNTHDVEPIIVDAPRSSTQTSTVEPILMNATGSSMQTSATPQPFPMQLESEIEEHPVYDKINIPPQTSETLHALLGAVHEMGFQYKALEDTQLTRVEDSEQEEIISRSPSPSLRLETPPPSTAEYPLAADESTKAALMVNLRIKQGLFKFAMLRTRLPKSALDTYDLLVKSEAASIVSRLSTMDDEEVMLATSRKPIPMDEKRSHEDVMAGYRELGRLSELDQSAKLKPVIDCEERRQLAQVQEVSDGTPIFVLYIWFDDGEDELASPQLPVAVRGQSSSVSRFVSASYLDLFQELVLDVPSVHSAFTSIIFVRIVHEVCQTLGIVCARRVGISRPDGPHNISIGEVMSSFRRKGDNTPHLTAKTFQNHRGWFFRTEQLYGTLATLYPSMSQIPNDMTDEKIMLKFARDLLKTPLTEARELSPKVYGQMTVFDQQVDALEKKYGLTKERKKGTIGKAASSRWDAEDLELLDNSME